MGAGRRCSNRSAGRSGFTLIELLIVVAILAILATLGAINYQDAVARGKLARVRADMQAICGALETYRIDQLAYPSATEAGGDILLDSPLTPLTTPVAYLGSVPIDPFGAAGYSFDPLFRQRGYLYKDRAGTSIGMSEETFGRIWRGMPGAEYLVHSCGPNRVWDVLPYEEYDATNGTVSTGDICRFGP